MSWIVQSLLNNREHIKENGDLDSDEFNDLMLIEKAIEELVAKKLLDADEVLLLETYKNPEFKKKTRNERFTISKKYAQICDRIAFYLGDYFTDDGYLHYIQDKYKFNEEQMNSLREYIKSEYKHKLIRKPLNNE